MRLKEPRVIKVKGDGGSRGRIISCALFQEQRRIAYFFIILLGITIS